MATTRISALDRAELAALASAYAYAVDARDREGVVALFTADATLMVPSAPQHLTPTRPLVGPIAIADELAQLEAFVVTSHNILGHHVVRSDGATAHGITRCEAHHVSRRGDGELRDLVWNLRYDDEYQRTPDGWKFARRELTIDIVDIRTVRDATPRAQR